MLFSVFQVLMVVLGIYLQGRFGIRHEDVFLVREDGEAEILSGRLALGPYEP